jgi:DNA-binding CsgD family transcriptional regulator
LAEVAPVLRLAATLQAEEPLWRPGLAVLFAELGMLDDARREFERLAPDRFAAVVRDAMWPGCLSFLGEVCVALADVERAEVLYRELDAFRGQTLMVGFTICLGPAERLMGSLAALAGRSGEAEAHFVAALELAERAGSPMWRAHVQHDWAVGLGNRPDLVAAAEATAVELGMDALTERCRSLSARWSASAEPSRPDGLSGREVEVLRLVAAGLSNRAIGERLLISQNTAANHIRSILQKTGSANRAEATAYAARHGLLSS